MVERSLLMADEHIHQLGDYLWVCRTPVEECPFPPAGMRTHPDGGLQCIWCSKQPHLEWDWQVGQHYWSNKHQKVMWWYTQAHHIQPCGAPREILEAMPSWQTGRAHAARQTGPAHGAMPSRQSAPAAMPSRQSAPAARSSSWLRLTPAIRGTKSTAEPS